MRSDIDQTNAPRLSTSQIGVKFGYSCFPEALEFCRGQTKTSGSNRGQTGARWRLNKGGIKCRGLVNQFI